MEIPVPVPNTEVKHPFADDTAERWESRTLPAFFLPAEPPRNHSGAFFFARRAASLPDANNGLLDAPKTRGGHTTRFS